MLPALALPDELLRALLLQCPLSTLRSLKAVCRLLRGSCRRVLCGAEWRDSAHGSQLGRPMWQGQEMGVPINGAHLDCLGESRGAAIHSVSGCAGRLVALTAPRVHGSARTELVRFDCEVEPVADANADISSPLRLRSAPGFGHSSGPFAVATDAEHFYVLDVISNHALDDAMSHILKFALESVTSNPASARLVGQRARPGRAGPDQHWPFRNYHVALSEGQLYLASCDAQHVSVFRTDDLAQVLAFDASSATPPRPPPPAAEEEPAAAADATVEVGADELEVIESDRGWYLPMGLAVGDQFIFVCQRANRRVVGRDPAVEAGDLDCVGAYDKETGELSHVLPLDQLGVEAVAVFHDRVYVLTLGVDERGVLEHEEEPTTLAAPRGLASGVPMLHWMGPRGEGRGSVPLLPDGYEGEQGLEVMGSLYVDGGEGSLIVTLDAVHADGGHSLCIPMRLADG